MSKDLSVDPHNLQSFREDTESDTSSYATPGPLLRVINWSKKSYWDTLSSYTMGRYKANVDIITSWEISKSAKILASPLCRVTSQQHTAAGLEGQVQQQPPTFFTLLLGRVTFFWPPT